MNKCGKVKYLKDGAIAIIGVFMAYIFIQYSFILYFSLFIPLSMPIQYYFIIMIVLYLVFYFKQSSNGIYYIFAIISSIYSLSFLNFYTKNGTFSDVKSFILILISISFLILIYAKHKCANSNVSIEEKIKGE